MEITDNWAIFYQGKIILIGEDTIKSIRQDPTEVLGWFDLELMIAWKNMFLLTVVSKRLGYLPMKDEAWAFTPNPWWRFLFDHPAVQFPSQISSKPPAIRSNVHPSEKLLTKAELEWIQSKITVRKILQEVPVECLMWGNLHQVKLLQFTEPKLNVTMLIKANQERMGIIKHSVTLFRGRMSGKNELMEA